MEEQHNPHPTDTVSTSGPDYSHGLLPASPSAPLTAFKHVTLSPQQNRLLPSPAWPSASLHTVSYVGLTIMSPAGGGPSPHHWVLLTCHYPWPDCSVLLALLHDLSPCNKVRAGTLPAIPHFLLHFHCCDKMHRQSKSK